MNIELLFFAQVRESFGTDRRTMTVERGDTVASVVQRLADRPEWQRLQALPMTFAVNAKVVGRDHKLQDGDCVALLTPVSGG